jgi:hypothetical protein
MLSKLYERFGEALREALASNPAAPNDLLQRWFEDVTNDEALAVALASNPALTEEQLEKLYDRGGFEVHKALAANAGCSDMLLEQLKLDSRLQPYLAQNEKLIRSYEMVLNQQKAMMNV